MRLGDWVRIKQSGSCAVIAQFEGRIGQIVLVGWRDDYPKYRICFGDYNDLYTNECNLEPVLFYWGKAIYINDLAPEYVW